jgi:NADH-quinone oxidoreductase subunit E
MSISHEKVAVIADRYGGNGDGLISILQDIQSEERYLPEEALRMVAGHLGIPLIQVYGVATFFKAFSLEPRGKHTASVCMGTACHVRGAPAVLDEFKRQLGIEPGQTTKDMQYTLDTVNCVGACALGPVAVIDDKHQGQMRPGKVRQALKRLKRLEEET